MRRRIRSIVDALKWLLFGVGTGFVALVTLVWTVAVALSCLVGVGLLLVPSVLLALRRAANLERRRLSRWGPEVIDPGPAPTRFREAVTDPAMRRELRGLVGHGTVGLALGVAGIAMVNNIVRDGTFPLWWRLLPAGAATASSPVWTVHDARGAWTVAALAPVWLALTVTLAPSMARWQAAPGRLLLAPDPRVDRTRRVAQLTATRAAALDAHAAELRRIERSLHDGTQNRIVAVNVLLGAARRALAHDPTTADAVLERAQDAAEQALAELRGVVRSILPPVLTDRSLADALAGLAADCPVPCRVDTDVPTRCAASVEATAYFVVAEALTNIAKHSGARQAIVTVVREGDRLRVRVIDDGTGGADEQSGSGIRGIRQRTEAHDGTLTLTSPRGGPTTLDVSLPCGS
jgi:signal transduction histidine kinase